MPHAMELRLLRSDCFEVDLSVLPKPFDLYLYDGGHSEEQQRKGLTYYLPVLADEFIFCCDDYSWPDVQKGTQDGIKESNLDILFEQEMITKSSHDNESWWNGFYVALLKKK
jgi:hypothetical protein